MLGGCVQPKLQSDRFAKDVKDLGAKEGSDVLGCKVALCAQLWGIIWTAISLACTACMKCAQLARGT